MYDTYVTVVGNVLTAPEWRRTKNTGSLVAHFKVASTARRLDRESGQWVDGNSLRVRVNCWRRLAEGVGSSLITGDPVIVVGRLYTRDWTDENNNRRIGYELEAVAVGHDLSRGQSKFTRNRAALSTSAVEDDQGALRIGGEQTDPVPADEVPVRRDGREFEDVPPVMPHPVGLGNGYGDAGRVETGDDELLGEDDDLGGTDESDVALGDAGSFAGGVTAVSFPAEGSTGDLELSPVGDSGLSAAGPDTGHGPVSTGEPDNGAAGDSAAPGEDHRGRGRRRGRTAVPV